MMLINGEKYACEACVRGHRVSTCQHSDRPLTHINKKGRPVSQCPHCRGLRKARAAHVACECGSKPHNKEDCGDPEAKGDLSETQSDSHSDPGSELQRGCCCSHGMRCTCALKKDHLNPVPEVGTSFVPRRRATSATKPRLIKAGSDNALTVFANGHHKPIHKHNDSAHKSGLPYQIPIPHSVNGNEDLARRSTDSLPLLRRKDEPANSAPQDLRLVRSAHGSPKPRPTSLFRENSSALPPLDLDYAPVPFADEYISSPQPARSFHHHYDPQDDAPVLSAGLHSTSSWADLSLPLEHTAYSTAYAPLHNYNTLDGVNVGPQCITSTPSSGDASDAASDYLSHSTPPQTSPFRPELSSNSSAETPNLDRLSSASLVSIPQTSIPAASLSPLDVKSQFHPTTASPTEFEDLNSLHADAFERHGFTVHDAQKMAHPETSIKVGNDLILPARTEELDQLLWNARNDVLQNTFVSPDMVESIGASGSHWR